MSLESQANQRSGPDEVVDTVCIHGEECCADWEDCGVFRHHLNSGDDSANGAALQESGISNDSNNTPLDGSGAKPECANGTEYGKGGLLEGRLLEGRTMEGGSRTNGVAEDGVVLRECEMMEENRTCSMAKEGDRVDETCSGMSGGGAAELEGGVGSSVGTSESERKGRALMGGRVEISECERGGSEGLGRVENNNVFGIGATGIADETSECGHTDTASGSRSLDDKQHDSADFEDGAGVDEVDFFWNRNIPLLEHCRDRSLNPELLDKIRQAGPPGGKSWDLDAIDDDGYGAIHYIVMGSRHRNKPSLLEALVIHGADIDLTTTYHGVFTAVHLAVEEDDLDCVKTLISLDADVNMEDSMGKTPLDLAKMKKKLVHAPNKGFKLATLDHGTATVEETLTASESVALRTTKKKRGRPSQHEEIIKLLESVGARKGSSSKVHPSSIASVGSTSSASHAYSTRYNVRKINTLYYRQVHDAIRGMLKEEEESVDPKKAVEFMKKMRGQEEYRRRCGSRVLCLDGGGIRGLLQMATLREIERQAGMKIVELFDWIVGTSTGGIIALSLTYGPPGEGRKTVRQLRDIYWGMKDEIFGESQDGLFGFLARGNTQKLEATLKSWLGEDVTLNQEAYPKVLIPAVSKKDTNLDLHFFNNCFADEYSKELVWKVGRYTSAAPFYFTEFENYIDGGMLANNPSEAALTVIQDFYHKRGEKIPIALLVSVGSGVNPGSPLGEIDIKKNLLKPRAYLNLMEVLESAVLSKQTASSCLSRCREQGIEYFRFNPELKRKVDSDQQNSTILQEMILTTRQYLNEEEVKKDMDWLIQLLRESDLTST